MHPSTVSHSSTGNSSWRSHWRPLTPNRSANGGRPISWRINIAWISFFARVRARISCSRRDSRRRSTRVSSSGIHTASSSPDHNSLANVLASNRSVFARACVIPVSPGETTITFATCGSRILTISHALPVTSNTTWSVSSRLSARTFSASGVDATRPAERTFPSSQIAISQKSRCTSNPIALPTALTTATATSPSSGQPTMNGRTVGTTTTTDTRSQRNRASRRGGHRKARARSPSSKTACPATFSQKAPIPITGP